MVERQITGNRIALTVAAAINVALAAGCDVAVAAGSPTDFGAQNDRPVATPMPPLPEVDGQAGTGTRQENPLWGVAIDALHATRERPLFSPSRRPPAPAAASAPAAPVRAVAPVAAPAFTLSLLGIVAGQDEAFAVFINTQTHDTVRLRTGEASGGWILRSVSRREAILENDHRTEVLKLPPPAGVPK